MSGLFSCSEVNFLVYLIVALFGIGSWVAVNGLWVELPLIVFHLPEGWNLPSYLTVIIQIANIGPIIVTLLYVFAKDKVNEKVIVYLLVIVGAASCLLLAFLWDKTSMIGGEEHSTALLVLQFFLATVDCTSSVVFLPFMALFKQQYMTAYFIGEGLSGLVPSLVALGQGVGKMTCVNQSITNSSTNITHYKINPVYEDPKFPVEDFFFFLFAMMLICGVAFTLLNYLPYCKNEHTKSKSSYSLGDEVAERTSLSEESSYEMDHGSVKKYDDPSDVGHSQSVLVKSKKRKRLNICSNSINNNPDLRSKMKTGTYVYYLALIAWINGLNNGVFPAIQTYACLPYGNDAYHLAVTLGNIANPVACFVAFFLPVKSSVVISSVTALGTAFGVYIMYLAVESPSPILMDGSVGAELVVTAWVLLTFFMTFSKVSIAALFRFEGKKALLWCGAVTQAGSAVAAILMYVVVNVLKVYQSAEYCPS